MRRLLTLALAAACAAPPEDTRRPGESFGAVPGQVDAAADYGSAYGMPLSLRTKFDARPGLVHVSPVESAGDLDSLTIELGPEDFQMLDEKLLAMATFGTLRAGSELDAGLFLLWRAAASDAGSEAASDAEAVLAAWRTDANRLIWLADLAWFQSDDLQAERHEAWVTDLDSDGWPEFVQRSTIRQASGGAEEVRWSAYGIEADFNLVERSVPLMLRTRLGAMSTSALPDPSSQS